MKATKEELIAAVNMAWSVACEASMNGQPPMVMSTDIVTGFQNVNGVRLGAYQAVLHALLPQNVRSEITQNPPKETWEE